MAKGAKPERLFPLKWDKRGTHPDLSKEEKEQSRAEMKQLVELWKDDDEE